MSRKNIHILSYCLNNDEEPLSYPHKRYFSTVSSLQKGHQMAIFMSEQLRGNVADHRGLAKDADGNYLIKVDTVICDSNIMKL